MTFSDVPYPNSSSNSSDDDIEVDTCIPSPWTQPHGKGNGLASASGSGAARDEIERGDEEEEIFEIEEINPSSYVHMVTPTLRQPQNLDWREKISYKDKTKLVREKRKENPRLVEMEVGIDYQLHNAFQEDFYESVIIPKNKPVVISQWIGWNDMESKHDIIFDYVVAAYRAKHLRDVMTFRKTGTMRLLHIFLPLCLLRVGTAHTSMG
jgi:hypothetical protein